MTKLQIRGENWEITKTGQPIQRWLNALTLALLALEDPRIDSVLEAANVVVENGDGLRLFPKNDVAILKVKDE
jgi:hypothetical protein